MGSNSPIRGTNLCILPCSTLTTATSASVSGPVWTLRQGGTDSIYPLEPYFQPPTAVDNVDPPLRPRGSLTIGYGSGGGAPFEYRLRDSQDVDVGFLRLFISTEPADLSGIEQLSPFEGVRESRRRNRSPGGTWSIMLITVVQRRKDPST
jgi:hypothetical protein